jgi:hypothetical protein
MTFGDLKRVVKDAMNLTSVDADTRVGIAINRHYRRISSLIGLDPIRFVTRSASMTVGVRTVTFSSIEKIDRLLDTTDATAIRLLQEASLHDLRSTQPSEGEPLRWATQNTGPDSVTILTDTVPQTAYSLQADGTASLADLDDDDEPTFSESYHDLLSWFVISEELLRKEKLDLSAEYRQRAEQLLSELRFSYADSSTKDTRQGAETSPSAASGTGGGGTTGATNYTQSGLLTFDRGAGITPFAVAQADAPYVANLGAEFLGNVTSDRLIGRDTASTGESEQLTVGGGIEFTGSGGIQTSAFTGDVTKSAGGTALTIAADAVTDAMLRESAACSVIGRSANSTGNPADITASSNGTMLARVANALSWITAIVVGTAARIDQIAFNATQNASADANTLDDYEEGTWTPVIGGSGGTSGQAYTTQTGSYVKIGQLVIATFNVVLSTLGTVTTSAQIQGLPFAAKNTTGLQAQFPIRWVNMTSSPIQLIGSVVVNETNANILILTAAGTSFATDAVQGDFANTTQLRGTVMYQANA